MSIDKVRSALETALNAMTPALSTAWENGPFTPINGTAYQRVNLLTAEPENPSIGNTLYREIGILQITLMYPKDTGSGGANARAELIRTTFKRGNSFTKDGVKVIVERTPEVSPGRVDGDRWSVPVRVRWYANVM